MSNLKYNNKDKNQVLLDKVEKHYKIEFLDENEEIIDTERYGNIEPDEDDYIEMAIKWKASSGILYSYDEDDEDDTFREEGRYETKEMKTNKN